MNKIFYLLVAICILSCQDSAKKITELGDYEEVKVDYAEGFSIKKYEDFTQISVHKPWPDAEKDLVYIIADEKIQLPKNFEYEALITKPIDKIVATSTTHIPSLISLNKIETLVGFPNLEYISSKEARQLIEDGKIRDIGQNESINTEVLLSLQPDLIFSFAIEGRNKTLDQARDSGIPVVYNSDWLEDNPLGKAEWIKFFGAFLGKLDQAESEFNQVVSEYESAKKMASKTENKPSVISGAMHQDRWYLPYGDSWQAQFFKDANAEYVYDYTKGQGSIALAFEKVLEKAKDSEFWISPGHLTSYEALLNNNKHYAEFEAFQNKNIYTMANTKGETGGVLFYELGPNRPDLILKDLVKIFHPDLLSDYELTFFKALE
ncbi:MAG: ABC transporter substrate-binding protein [Psychroflexus sp.]